MKRVGGNKDGRYKLLRAGPERGVTEGNGPPGPSEARILGSALWSMTLPPVAAWYSSKTCYVIYGRRRVATLSAKAVEVGRMGLLGPSLDQPGGTEVLPPYKAPFHMIPDQIEMWVYNAGSRLMCVLKKELGG